MPEATEPQNPPVFTLAIPQTFRLFGTGLDRITKVSIIAKKNPVSWSASIDPSRSPTSLLVMATPSLVNGDKLSPEDDQILIKPVGSAYKMVDTFILNESVAIHCTVLSDGSTVYSPQQEVSLVARYAAKE